MSKLIPVVVLVGLSVACSAVGDSARTGCSGEFFFDGIAQPSLRDDAANLIMEFAALDEHVTAERRVVAGKEAVSIRGSDGQCRHFANSFLASDMPEFQGLTYREAS